MYANPIDAARDKALTDLGLPEIAYIDNTWDKSPGASPVIAVKRGEAGYYPIHTQLTADELNADAGVTPAQREAMQIGSMMGWTALGANPRMHAKLSKK